MTGAMSEHLLIRACRGEPVERTPVWAMRQAGRWDPEFLKLRSGREFYEFSASPDLAAEASLLPMRFGVDGIILFYDITTLAVAMGMRFTLEPDRGPVPGHAIRTAADVAALAGRPDPDRFGSVLELLRTARRRLNGSLPILVFASAPFTLASYCIGTGKDVSETIRFGHEQPQVWEAILDKIAEATVCFLDALAGEGASAYQLFDSWAGGLPVGEYDRWSQRYHRQILAACRAIPSILFVRECPYLDQMARTGANVISLGTRHDLAHAQAKYPDLCFQGNVDHEMLAGGTVSQVRDATRRCLEAGKGRRHILNLNHGVDRRTPVENFREFVNTAREMSSKPSEVGNRPPPSESFSL
jgi:uroporphyrinogen decarboxylase